MLTKTAVTKKLKVLPPAIPENCIVENIVAQRSMEHSRDRAVRSLIELVVVSIGGHFFVYGLCVKPMVIPPGLASQQTASLSYVGILEW